MSFIPEATFNEIFGKVFLERTKLGVGRLLDAAAVIIVFYAIIDRSEKIKKWLGWFFVPLGQASFYVFIMHLIVVLLLFNLISDSHSIAFNTLVHAAAILLLWSCVRTKFLFSVIPLNGTNRISDFDM